MVIAARVPVRIEIGEPPLTIEAVLSGWRACPLAYILEARVRRLTLSSVLKI